MASASASGSNTTTAQCNSSAICPAAVSITSGMVTPMEMRRLKAASFSAVNARASAATAYRRTRAARVLTAIAVIPNRPRFTTSSVEEIDRE